MTQPSLALAAALALMTSAAAPSHVGLVMNANGSHVVRIAHSAAHAWSTQPDWERGP